MKLKSLLQEITGDIFKDINGLKYRELSASGGPRTKKALELLAKKIVKRTDWNTDGLEYASGVYHAAVKGSYDFKYSSDAYDEMYDNTTSEFEKDVKDLVKILKADGEL